MLVGYSGKILDGQPVLLEKVALPENADIIVMIEMPPPRASRSREQLEALDEFLVAIRASQQDEPIDEEFLALLDRGIHRGAELEL